MSESLIGVELTLAQANPELEEVVEMFLWELGLGGFERWDDETWTELVEEPRPRPKGCVRWRFFFDGEVGQDGAREAVAEAVASVDGLEVFTWHQTDMSFLWGWKEFFKPAQVSPRITVHPPWDVPTSQTGVLIEIDPGMAFGTGTHETTRLCLRAIDEAMNGVERVLDVGTGSGILAIAAARLGAKEVLGTDNDPIAVDIANENFERNGVDSVCRATTDDLDRVGSRWHMVVANILPHTLSELHDGLIAAVGPRGKLVLSGILNRERDGVLERFSDFAPDPIVTSDGEWCAITYTRPD